MGYTLGYLAGFIDADGCISYSRDKKTGKVYWEICAVQSEANGIGPLEALHERWGGSLHKRTPRLGKLKQNSPLWCWKAKGIEAAIAMQDMYFHLVVKKDRCQEALEEFVADPKIARILYRIGEPKP